MLRLENFHHGMGIGGWLTNYKRFNVLRDEWRMPLTKGDYEHFETYITERDALNIKKMGFDHVRIGFDQIVLEESEGKYREDIFKLLENFVKACQKQGLRVVLNLHKCIGNYCDIKEEVGLFDSEALQNRFIALWAEIERRFHDDNTLLFELLNEVTDVNPDLWNGLAERTVKALRALNPERIFIVGGVNWNGVGALDALKVLDDEKVVYTFHMYAPMEFTHQRGVLQEHQLYYNRVMQYPSEDIERYRDYHRLVYNAKQPYKDLERMDIQFLRQHLAPAVRFIQNNPDKILWCGEFGTIRHADLRSRENYMNDVIKIFEENGMPYCVWNYLSTPNDGNRFSLVDDETREILSLRLLDVCNGRVE